MFSNGIALIILSGFTCMGNWGNVRRAKLLFFHRTKDLFSNFSSRKITMRVVVHIIRSMMSVMFHKSFFLFKFSTWNSFSTKGFVLAGQEIIDLFIVILCRSEMNSSLTNTVFEKEILMIRTEVVEGYWLIGCTSTDSLSALSTKIEQNWPNQTKIFFFSNFERSDQFD